MIRYLLKATSCIGVISFLVPYCALAQLANGVVPPVVSLQTLRIEVFHNPNDATAHHDLGCALVTAGQSFEGILELKTAAWIAPTNEEFQVDLGTAEAGSGDAKSARSTFESVIKIDPSNTKAQLGLAELLCASGQAHGALYMLALAAAKSPTSFTAHYDYGEALLVGGLCGNAEVEFLKCRQILPTDTAALTALATVEAETGETSAAAATLNDALALQTMAPEAELQAHLQLASIYLQLGQPGDAVDESRKALTVSPVDPTAQNGLGAALYANGDLKDAQVEWRLALKSNDQAAQETARQWLSCL
jgi:Flp pilus assembly protein TadD